MSVSAKWVGREQVYAKLRQIVPDAETGLAAAQLEGAQELATRIRPRAPKLTGRYAASIEGDKLVNRPSDRFVGAGLKGKTKDPNATGIFADFKWRWLEFGTVKVAAQPHIFPTFRAYKRNLRRKMANAVNKAVRKAKQK